MFATLDTRTRKWQLDGGAEVLLSDTVGFIRNLPHQLVESFKATLEEAINADLLLHIVDVSSADALKQIESVNNVLAEIGCSKKQILLVLNKVDVVSGLTRSRRFRRFTPTQSASPPKPATALTACIRPS